MYLARTLLAQGKPEDSLAMLQQETDEGFRLMLLPTALFAAGRKEEADEALKAQIDHWGEVDAFCIAGSYAYRGDHDTCTSLARTRLRAAQFGSQRNPQRARFQE